MNVHVVGVPLDLVWVEGTWTWALPLFVLQVSTSVSGNQDTK